MLGADAVIERTVILGRLQARLARRGHLGVVAVAIEDLDLQAVGGGVAAERCAEGDAVVASRRKLELDADDAVLEFLLGQQVAALAGLADNRAVFHLVVGDGTLPVAEILPVYPLDKAGL